ncbi:MAG: phosphate uptake regulator PhoU [Desulfurococcales archaeon]|nr:phosphate uptake regulator PhoU [Desulfurococcales archaeon]
MGIDLVRRDLDRIYSNLDKLYNLVERILRDTIEALSSWREEDLEDRLYIVESMTDMIEEQATFFIAKYQPLGQELLEAKSLIRASYDLYRISRYCREINRVIRYMRGRGIKPSRSVLETASLVVEMVEKAYRSYRSRDAGLREAVEGMDNSVDSAYTSMLEKIASSESLSRDAVVDLLVLRHLERIADHAVYMTKHV